MLIVMIERGEQGGVSEHGDTPSSSTSPLCKLLPVESLTSELPSALLPSEGCEPTSGEKALSIEPSTCTLSSSELSTCELSCWEPSSCELSSCEPPSCDSLNDESPGGNRQSGKLSSCALLHAIPLSCKLSGCELPSCEPLSCTASSGELLSGGAPRDIIMVMVAELIVSVKRSLTDVWTIFGNPESTCRAPPLGAAMLRSSMYVCMLWRGMETPPKHALPPQ